MRLDELIAELEKRDPAQKVALGFGKPSSYRGDYSELQFEPVENTTVGEMLAHARSALGATMEGYKGGDFVMKEHTSCWLCEYGKWPGETIGHALLAFMMGETPTVETVRRNWEG